MTTFTASGAGPAPGPASATPGIPRRSGSPDASGPPVTSAARAAASHFTRAPTEAASERSSTCPPLRGSLTAALPVPTVTPSAAPAVQVAPSSAQPSVTGTVTRPPESAGRPARAYTHARSPRNTRTSPVRACAPAPPPRTASNAAMSAARLT